ncbi:UNKNOWN [Stylonychia lemnae]|uniref:Uncharacterized protein n=1 Tax=Stylonychia lemnae TaxID=5949 RepID=A0A077ZTC6_STYLE|nr:UNKNOWN [Stylonychia lemnae]|eukprot:CDW72580.1 UNKNOWN [Stylonychia lemnae]
MLPNYQKTSILQMLLISPIAYFDSLKILLSSIYQFSSYSLIFYQRQSFLFDIWIGIKLSQLFNLEHQMLKIAKFSGQSLCLKVLTSK